MADSEEKRFEKSCFRSNNYEFKHIYNNIKHRLLMIK